MDTVGRHSDQTQTGAQPDRPAAWEIAWRAIRPHTLPLSLSPVLAGSLVGWVEGGAMRLDITLAAALSAACMQIGANLQNDAADALNGTDNPGRPGPERVTQMGWISPEHMQRCAWLSFVLAVLSGAYLVMLGGWPLLCLGLLAVASAWAYSSGPRPISRGPLGELVVLLFFGLVAVAGVAWLYTGSVPVSALLLGLAIGLPAAAVLSINNLRDHASDRLAGRSTLAIRLGPRWTTRLIAGMLLTVAPVLLLLAGQGQVWLGALAGLLALPLAVTLIRRISRADQPEDYNRGLKHTTLWQFLLTGLIVFGVLASHLWVGL